MQNIFFHCFKRVVRPGMIKFCITWISLLLGESIGKRKITRLKSSYTCWSYSKKIIIISLFPYVAYISCKSVVVPMYWKRSINEWWCFLFQIQLSPTMTCSNEIDANTQLASAIYQSLLLDSCRCTTCSFLISIVI